MFKSVSIKILRAFALSVTKAIALGTSNISSVKKQRTTWDTKPFLTRSYSKYFGKGNKSLEIIYWATSAKYFGSICDK